MRIEAATERDYAYIRKRDRHLREQLITAKIQGKEIYILRTDDGDPIGWLRYGYFWDNTPFMNLLWIDEPYRGQGAGKRAVLYWEDMLREQGFKLAMTSTLANEGAQHFYRKLGYKDAGCLLLENEPLEIMMTKNL
ncbi:ribosomal protein S18 acetylase RimI-like enzyme [Paenibacillus phyllosphaerae]|uniref:Ribosomal protein S18 acetylase RimI-like enzyme n=1 Tax=Paenibacillus phyllosphaerae TaxID=274593 RepID=A0A7W5AZW9_9BACL|nr:GNAT family N-acetyltransferase [Paenibacillus phyllosphaerae]MBB3111873.1 ribosomal protein S18 acetylase RimI-like enzyme [Paenibacillus phyllosphaerae]